MGRCFRPQSRRRVKWLVAGAVLIAGAGCVRRSGGPAAQADRTAPPAAPATTQPAEATAAAPESPLLPPTLTFESRGVRFDYPGDWQPRPSDDYVLKLVGSSGSEMTLDVPALPPHLPGLIPLGMVENGYLDDLKQSYPGLKIDERSDHAVPGARARLVRSTWPVGDGTDRAEVALLMVHGDHVYILRLTGPAPQVAAARPVFDETARSIRWTN